MKEEDLKNKTTEELQSELKQTKTLTGALTGVLILLYSVTIYGLIAKEEKTTFIALIAVAISCSLILAINFAKIKEIKNELKLRVDNG